MWYFNHLQAFPVWISFPWQCNKLDPLTKTRGCQVSVVPNYCFRRQGWTFILTMQIFKDTAVAFSPRRQLTQHWTENCASFQAAVKLNEKNNNNNLQTMWCWVTVAWCRSKVSCRGQMGIGRSELSRTQRRTSWGHDLSEDCTNFWWAWLSFCWSNEKTTPCPPPQ